MSELKPEISTASRFNPIWIVPLVAVVIGVYMVVHTMLTEGPEVTISFTSADGVEAGKTKLRYRDVDIGVVESVRLSESMDKVLVTAKLDRAASDMLREDTRFWVVTARIGKPVGARLPQLFRKPSCPGPATAMHRRSGRGAEWAAARRLTATAVCADAIRIALVFALIAAALLV